MSNTTIPSVDSETYDVQRDVVREFTDGEDDILTGDANVLPNINYKAKATMRLRGIGVLNGLYYVEKVTHTFDKDNGYTQVLSLSKNGIGDSIKRGIVCPTTTTATQESIITSTYIPVDDTIVTRPVVSPPQPAPQRTYTVVSGDSLWKIARKYYGDGNKYTVIYDANRNIISSPNLIYPNQVLIIP